MRLHIAFWFLICNYLLLCSPNWDGWVALHVNEDSCKRVECKKMHLPFDVFILCDEKRDFFLYSCLPLTTLTICLICWPDWQQSNLSDCTEWQAIMDIPCWGSPPIKNTHTTMTAWKGKWWNIGFIHSHNEALRDGVALYCEQKLPPNNTEVRGKIFLNVE